MKQIPLLEGWTVRPLEGTREQPVTLPHDAQCTEPRSADSPGEHNIGWFACRDYLYRKVFCPAESWRGQKVLLELEGVYHNAEVFLNGTPVARRPYGYSNFYADLTDTLRWGQDNELRVIARNADQPNTRWYSGAGIYRPVSLWLGPRQQHIPVNGLRVRTLGLAPARVEVTVQTSCPGPVRVEVWEGAVRLAAAEGMSNGTARMELELENARPWSCETPQLYTCRAVFGQDAAATTFGIRTLTWSADQGLQINGQRVILRGACIHHDNGMLGAAADPQAEARKVRILKRAGYNALRSAHNPCSKALLDACDRQGMLVMDEFVDCWYIHKTKNDYVLHFADWWQRDLQAMVEKDYNHPSVILYSTGNEVSETATPRGAALTGELTRYLHSLDDTRPVTCGINIFFNLLSSLGFGVYSDEKAEKAAPQPQNKKKKAVGSEFYNRLACMLGDKTMKLGAALPPCDGKTRQAFANMDIAGYNYGIYRYRHDLKKYPQRLILGSETFCQDAYAFWELARREPRLIGDFVWAGMDYLGETGVGRWDYNAYGEQPASDDPGWLSSGAGRVDILGNETAEAAYTKVAFGLDPGPVLAVRPVRPRKKPPVGAWNLTDALMSWSWQGCDGFPAQVEVYARAAAVELRLNGKSLGCKRLKNRCRAVFRTTYHDGLLEAVAYDGNGREIGRRALQTAAAPTRLEIRPEEPAARPGSLCYLHLRYTDPAGIWKPLEQHTMQIRVTGGRLLGFGNAANYNPDGFWQDTARTWWGEAMALVRADGQGPVKIEIRDETGTWRAEIPCRTGEKTTIRKEDAPEQTPKEGENDH